MYTLIAVFVHFNHFIDLKINFHTNPYNLASSTAVVILGALWNKQHEQLFQQSVIAVFISLFI